MWKAKSRPRAGGTLQAGLALALGSSSPPGAGGRGLTQMSWGPEAPMSSGLSSQRKASPLPAPQKRGVFRASFLGVLGPALLALVWFGKRWWLCTSASSRTGPYLQAPILTFWKALALSEELLASAKQTNKQTNKQKYHKNKKTLSRRPWGPHLEGLTNLPASSLVLV